MSISFNPEKKIFKLDTSSSTYAFQVFDENYLVHLYYGAKIPDDNLESMYYHGWFASFSPSNAKVANNDFSPDMSPMEYSCEGAGDFRISALAILNSDGNNVTDIRYTGYRIINGKPELDGLPSLYLNDESEAQTLEVYTEDKTTGAKVTLVYTVFENYPVITRNVIVENASDKPFDIERVYSCCVEFPQMNYNMMHLYGKWLKERSLQVRHLAHGIQSICSKRGSSSHYHNPFVALADDKATEDYGEVYGFNLVYSSNFSAEIEVDSSNSTRLIMGINPESFGWHLEKGESFVSPEVVMVYSNEGIGGMSRAFHDIYRNNLIRGYWKNRKRPILINSWEACYFDFDDDKIVSFAERAKEMGIEMLVMDDGWFGERNDDTSSLGDWFVNEKKLKGGLGSLIDRVRALGLKFGIWYEPEMISPESRLYKEHPDWCVHVPNREKSIARQQYVIDMSRKDVRDNIFNQIYGLLSKYPVDYLKWDFNRNITEAGSALLPPERQKEFFHRFVLGTYELMGRLTKAFPEMLLENCSGGGGRFDPGMLSFSPQIWCSDNTDPIERLTIQFGSSMCYPDLCMGAHVSACSRTNIDTRANVALWGTFGYELDPNKMSDEDKEAVKKQIEKYNKFYDIIHSGDLYRIISPFENHYRAVWQFVSKDKTKTILTSVVMRKPESPAFFVRLKGLDPDKYYKDEEDGEVYSGALLMNAGLNLTRTDCSDGSSFIKYFTAV